LSHQAKVRTTFAAVGARALATATVAANDVGEEDGDGDVGGEVATESDDGIAVEVTGLGDNGENEEITVGGAAVAAMAARGEGPTTGGLAPQALANTDPSTAAQLTSTNRRPGPVRMPHRTPFRPHGFGTCREHRLARRALRLR
jgi:Flp pilus assembly protein TadG